MVANEHFILFMAKMMDISVHFFYLLLNILLLFPFLNCASIHFYTANYTFYSEYMADIFLTLLFLLITLILIHLTHLIYI